jgi:nucleoid DNA-binding protein
MCRRAFSPMMAPAASMEMPMELEELVAKVEAARPGLIGLQVPPEVAAAILRLAFQAIREELHGVEEGVVHVAGFGTFRVKSVVEMDGDERVTRKLIAFRYRQNDRLPG